MAIGRSLIGSIIMVVIGIGDLIYGFFFYIGDPFFLFYLISGLIFIGIGAVGLIYMLIKAMVGATSET